MKPLTIYFLCIDFSIDHPVGLEDHISCQAPRRLLIWRQDGFPGDPEAQQHYCHHHHDEEHVTGLGKHRGKWDNKKKILSNFLHCTKLFLISTHHLSDHCEVRTSMLIDSQQICHSDKPEDEVQTVRDAPCCPVGISMPSHCQSSQEEQDGNEV